MHFNTCPSVLYVTAGEGHKLSLGGTPEGVPETPVLLEYESLDLASVADDNRLFHGYLACS